jgi:hypothetical protein
MKSASRRGRVAFLICSGWLLITSVPAQTPDTAALRGGVSGPIGEPLSGASVAIEDARHHLVRTLQTNAQGTFAAEGLQSVVLSRSVQPIRVLPQYFAGLQIPHSEGLVPGSGDRTPPVRTDRHAKDQVGMADKRAKFLADLQIPNLERVVRGSGDSSAIDLLRVGAPSRREFTLAGAPVIDPLVASVRSLLSSLLLLAQPLCHFLVLRSDRCPTHRSSIPAKIEDRHVDAAVD